MVWSGASIAGGGAHWFVWVQVVQVMCRWPRGDPKPTSLKSRSPLKPTTSSPDCTDTGKVSLVLHSTTLVSIMSVPA